MVNKRRPTWRQKWQGVKRRVKATNWTNTWRTGVSVGGVIFGIWLSLMQSNYRTLKEDYDALKIKHATLETTSTLQGIILTSVSTRIDSCEKRLHDEERRVREIEDAARELPPSRHRRRILSLTRKPIGRIQSDPRAEKRTYIAAPERN